MSTGVELATAWVRLVPSFEGVQGEVTKALDPAAAAAEASGDKAGKKWSGALKAGLLAGGALAVGGLVKVFNVGLEELKFGEKVSAETDLLVKNMGAAFSTDMIEKYTLKLSQVSGVSEEELQQAGNTLLKFGITNEDTYKRAVASINDMAASGKDAAQVGQALGKALQDPTLAVAGLRKQGVAFTQEQEDMIAAMVEAGDVAGAQEIILAQVEQTYGGMAEAAGGTLEGNLNKLNNAFENMAGDLVETLMPAVTGLIAGLQGFVGWLSENTWAVGAFAAVIGVLLVAAFIAWTASIWASTIALLANPITWIIIAIVLLIAAIVLLVMNWDAVVAWITEIWAGFIAWIVTVIDGFVAWWNSLWAGFASWIGEVWNGFVTWITAIWQGFINWIIAVIVGYFSWWMSIWTAIGAAISSIWQGFVSVVSNIWNGFVGWIMGVVNGFMSWWNGIWGTVGDVIQSVFGGIASFIGGIWDGIVGGIRSAVNSIIRIINGVIDGVNGLISGAGALLGISISIPKIPMLAEGGVITGSGSVIVGENGPEILNLPRGASVDPDISHLDRKSGMIFNNYAPLGQSPAQALTEFANRAEAFD